MRINPVTQHLPSASGVYEMVNKQNGKVYVGSSVDIRARIRGHICLLNRGTHHGRHLQAAWNKHGEAAFIFHVLELCPAAQLIERESFWMKQKLVLDPARGYNSPEHIAKRAASRRGSHLPQSTKDAIAEGNRRRTWSPEQREAARVRLQAGKRAMAPEEFSKRLSASMRGRKLTEEHKKKLSEARRLICTPPSPATSPEESQMLGDVEYPHL